MEFEPEPEQKTRTQTQPAIILTNGYLNVGYNYVYMFKTKQEAIDHAGKMGIYLKKYNYFKLDIPIDATSINLMVTQEYDVNKNVKLQVINNRQEHIDAAFEYYKKAHSESDIKLSITSNLIFNKNKTIFQMFGNIYKNSYCFMSNLEFSKSDDWKGEFDF
jgi:hypothetical protein